MMLEERLPLEPVFHLEGSIRHRCFVVTNEVLIHNGGLCLKVQSKSNQAAELGGDDCLKNRYGGAPNAKTVSDTNSTY